MGRLAPNRHSAGVWVGAARRLALQHRVLPLQPASIFFHSPRTCTLLSRAAHAVCNMVTHADAWVCSMHSMWNGPNQARCSPIEHTRQTPPVRAIARATAQHHVLACRDKPAPPRHAACCSLVRVHAHGVHMMVHGPLRPGPCPAACAHPQALCNPHGNRRHPAPQYHA